MKIKNKKFRFSTPQTLVLGVIITIFIGAIILKLPISNNNEKSISFLDSCFTATSAVCVTGLNVIVPANQFSFFGKIVILILIELGGIGFMSFVTLILMIMRKKINLSDRLLIKESLNQSNDKGMVSLIRKILAYITFIELIGSIILSIQFVPEYGLKDGIGYSIFHSVSAVCNAGFDILGDSSFIKYQYNPLISITIMILIIIGGVGFSVWTDIICAIKKILFKKINIIRICKEFTTHTKIVLITSFILFLSGTVLTFLFEKNNINIMKNDSLGNKILKSSFYSTTLRTAGFETVDSTELTTVTKFFSAIFMFIGASPASTGGGIKTTTFAIFLLMIYSFIRGEEDTNIFKRKIPERMIKRAIVIMSLSLFIIGALIIGLAITEDLQIEQNTINNNTIINEVKFIDIFYEVFSAFGTVGLTLGITPNLSVGGKIIIMVLMFIGRIGPITLSFALVNRANKNINIKYPECDILVG